MLEPILARLFAEYATRHTASSGTVSVVAPNPWGVDARFTLSDGEFGIRSLSAGDEDALIAFGARMSDGARDFFSPYPWNDPVALRKSFTEAIGQSDRRVDASYVLEHNGDVIGHFFLWKAGGNPQSLAYAVAVPELGIAVADAFHGKGLGGLIMRVLREVAIDLNADAIELTTALTNESGWRTYLSAGYEHVGMIRIPLDIDVTSVDPSAMNAARYRTERQMVDVLKLEKRGAVMRYLSEKRVASGCE